MNTTPNPNAKGSFIGELMANKTFLVVFIAAIALSIFGLDKTRYTSAQFDFFIWLNDAMQVLPADFWNNLTNLADAAILFPILSFIAIRNPRMWAALFGAVPLATLLSRVGKDFFAMPRPAAVLEHDQFHIIAETLTGHSSFPSGHGITIFTAVFVILVVHFRDQLSLDKPINKLLVSFVAIAGLFIGFSRVAVGAHWPMDLALAAAVGYMAALSGEYLSRRYLAWWNWMTTKPHIFSLFNLLFPIAIIVMLFKGKLEIITVVILGLIVGTAVSVYNSVKAFKQA